MSFLPARFLYDRKYKQMLTQVCSGVLNIKISRRIMLISTVAVRSLLHTQINSNHNSQNGSHYKINS